jgi:hypothetical protein
MHFLLLFAVVAVSGWAEDRGVGHWRFDKDATVYESSAGPARSVRIWEVTGQGEVRFTHRTRGSSGRQGLTSFTARYDGGRYAVHGSSRYDTVALELVDPNTVEQTFRKGEEITVRARRVISPDGGTMTITATGKNPDGKDFRNVMVYRRCPDAAACEQYLSRETR